NTGMKRVIPFLLFNLSRVNSKTQQQRTERKAIETEQ
ncbi:hypothetical protein A2U01_0072736, partial [Trifolium medium]|nr:hypothetical protein [Trifolium medium]